MGSILADDITTYKYHLTHRGCPYAAHRTLLWLFDETAENFTLLLF